MKRKTPDVMSTAIDLTDPFVVAVVCGGVFIVMWIVSRLCGGDRASSRASSSGSGSGSRAFKTIPDAYGSLEEVQGALRRAGLESSSLIIGIDYTKSNVGNGVRTFGGRSLHWIDHSVAPGRPERVLNPYQRVISILGRTLTPFDDDGLLPVFGFGDSRTTNKTVFPLRDDGHPCYSFEDVLTRYEEITPLLTLAGPTSFAPLIYRAIDIVKEEAAYHILVILCDGQVVNKQATRDAIVEASNYPLSIITIGVGDGPWELMHQFDDELPARRFDNFQFVDADALWRRAAADGASDPDAYFALASLMEIPEQYKTILALDML